MISQKFLVVSAITRSGEVASLYGHGNGVISSPPDPNLWERQLVLPESYTSFATRLVVGDTAVIAVETRLDASTIREIWFIIRKDRGRGSIFLLWSWQFCRSLEGLRPPWSQSPVIIKVEFQSLFITLFIFSSVKVLILKVILTNTRLSLSRIIRSTLRCLLSVRFLQKVRYL